MTKRGLGKGLKALLADQIEENNLIEVNTHSLQPNPYQPRQDFSQESIEELSLSIRKHGIIQPVVVVEKEGQYFLVVGERRWRAAKLANLTTIPALVKKLENRDIMEIALIENLQREDLNVLETAYAYHQLLEEFSLTQEELADRVGKSRAAITNTLRLLKLPKEIQHLIRKGFLSGGHAKALLGLKEEGPQLELAKRIIEEEISVRETEKIVRAWEEDSLKPEKKKCKEKNCEIKELEERLQQFFGTKVAINTGKKKGKIEIEYYSQDDLERILGCLLEN